MNRVKTTSSPFPFQFDFERKWDKLREKNTERFLSWTSQDQQTHKGEFARAVTDLKELHKRNSKYLLTQMLLSTSVLNQDAVTPFSCSSVITIQLQDKPQER